MAACPPGKGRDPVCICVPAKTGGVAGRLNQRVLVPQATCVASVYGTRASSIVCASRRACFASDPTQLCMSRSTDTCGLIPTH